MRLRPLYHLRMRREPHVAQRARVADQFLYDPDARAISDHMRMHGELKHAAFTVRRLELAPEDVEDASRRGVRAMRLKAVHPEIDRVVTDPLDRQLHHAGRFAL